MGFALGFGLQGERHIPCTSAVEVRTEARGHEGAQPAPWRAVTMSIWGSRGARLTPSLQCKARKRMHIFRCSANFLSRAISNEQSFALAFDASSLYSALVCQQLTTIPLPRWLGSQSLGMRLVKEAMTRFVGPNATAEWITWS